jgi:hypothetical protein
LELTQDDSELIPFSNAASRIYTEITGDYLSLFGDPAQKLLHEVAQVIARLVPIYGAATGHESLRALPGPELKHGTFQHAATLMRTSNGTEYRRLHIRRGDVRAAVIALRDAGRRFPSARSETP